MHALRSNRGRTRKRVDSRSCSWRRKKLRDRCDPEILSHRSRRETTVATDYTDKNPDLKSALSAAYSMVTFSIFTSDTGRSLRVGVVAIELTTSCPSVTRPKIV